METENIEDAEINIGGLPHGNISGSCNPCHVQKAPVRRCDINPVHSVEIYHFNHLTWILKMGRDDNWGFFFEPSIIVYVILWDGVFKDDIIRFNFACQRQRLFDGVESVAGIQDNA